MKLPMNEEVENGLLSSLLIAPEKVGCMMAERGVTEAMFHHPVNHILAGVMLEAWREGRKMDASLLMLEINRKGLIAQVGDYFDRVHYIPTAANAEQYIDEVINVDRLRRIALLCAEKEKQALSAGADALPLISEISTEINGMVNQGQQKRAKTMKEHIRDKMDRVMNGEDDANVIRTGIKKLDEQSPLKAGDMPLISGERKAGKSIFSINIALNVALSGEPVVYFSLEDMAPKVIDRMVARESRIPIIMHTESSVAKSEKMMRDFENAAVRLAKTNIILRDDVFDLMGIVAAIRQEKIRHANLRLAVVDYAQLVRFQMPKGSSREQEVATISRSLRLLAMELNIAILLLCQLNKDGDTRESKALEQDCTTMWKVTHVEPMDNGKRMIVIPYQRNGDSMIAFPVTFIGAESRIETFAEDEQ